MRDDLPAARDDPRLAAAGRGLADGQLDADGALHELEVGRSCEIVTDGTSPPISASVTAAAMARNAAMPMVSRTGASSSMAPWLPARADRRAFGASVPPVGKGPTEIPQTPGQPPLPVASTRRS